MTVATIRFAFATGIFAVGVHAQQTLRITSPTEGAIVHAGQELTVKVEASPADAPWKMMIFGENPIGDSRELLEHPPYTFTLPIPRKIRPREYLVTAGGFTAPGQGTSSHPVSVHVERPEIPVEIIPGEYCLTTGGQRSSAMCAYRSLQLSEVGWSAMIYVLGIFAEGEEVDLSESSYLQYSSDNPRVVKVIDNGTVISTGIGSAKITIRYRAKSVIVPVMVGLNR